MPKAAQPFPLGEIDQLYVNFRIEEEVALGKRVRYAPEWLSVILVVDQNIAVRPRTQH